jgi:hypothetical protein
MQRAGPRASGRGVRSLPLSVRGLAIARQSSNWNPDDSASRNVAPTRSPSSR